MTTTLLLPEIPEVLEASQPVLFEFPHMRMVGNTRYWCIQEDCDGVHHFMCSCER
jgi:hypothetical protein